MTDLPSNIIWTNAADLDPLSHALFCRELADFLGIGISDSKKLIEPVKLPAFSALLGKPCYQVPGLDVMYSSPTEDKVKGFEALGYIGEHVHDAIESLNDLAKLQETIQAFAKERKVDASELSTIDSQALCASMAIWSAFHDRPIVCPTSGNFGLSMTDMIERMRHTTIPGTNIPILAENEGSVVPWLPHPSVSDPAKLRDVVDHTRAFHGMKPLENDKIDRQMVTMQNDGLIGLWKERKTRDVEGLIGACERGGYYCHTNPFSPRELALLLQGVQNLRGDDFFLQENTRRCLSTLGVNVSETSPPQFEVRRGIMGGEYGLLLPHLEVTEFTLANNIANQEIVIQPSAGGTAAASVIAHRIVSNAWFDRTSQHTQGKPLNAAQREVIEARLARYYPRLAAALSGETKIPLSRLLLARHTGNDNLIKGLGKYNIPGSDHPTSTRAISGLGTVTPADIPIEAFERSLEDANSSREDVRNSAELRSPEDIIPVPIIFTKLAQMLLFADRVATSQSPFARMPEEAAAVSGGLILQELFQKQQLHPQDVAYLLLTNGITKPMFDRLSGHGEAKLLRSYDGREYDNFAKKIIEHIDSVNEFPQLRQRLMEIEPHLSHAFRQRMIAPDTATTRFMYTTGNTGTAGYSEEWAGKILANQSVLKFTGIGV